WELRAPLTQTLSPLKGGERAYWKCLEVTAAAAGRGRQRRTATADRKQAVYRLGEVTGAPDPPILPG
ncbi:MAG: hypothetical protein H7840_15555, partial [Alphaproteobacteria bacterium]